VTAMGDDEPQCGEVANRGMFTCVYVVL
jgi:hypothetical protein